ESDDLSDWDPGTQANNLPDYQAEALTEETYYRRIVESGVCQDTTSILTVEINSLPVLNQLTAVTPLTVICDDQPFRLKLDIQNGKAPYKVEYRNGIDPAGIMQNLPSDTSSFPVNI